MRSFWEESSSLEPSTLPTGTSIPASSRLARTLSVLSFADYSESGFASRLHWPASHRLGLKFVSAIRVCRPAARKTVNNSPNTAEIELLQTRIVKLQRDHANQLLQLEEEVLNLQRDNRRLELAQHRAGANTTELPPGGYDDPLQGVGCNILFALFYVARDNRTRVGVRRLWNLLSIAGSWSC
jgi:hypothetical protein